MATKTVLLALLLAIATLATPALAEVEADGGYFVLVSDGGPIGSRTVEWIWAPHYLPGGIDYAVFLICERFDAFGNEVGKNKVIMKDFAFLGLDSDELIEYTRVSRKLNKFRRSGHLVFGAPDLEVVANDFFVLARVVFDVKGSSAPGDLIQCFADVSEEPLVGVGAVAKAASEPKPSLFEVMTADRPEAQRRPPIEVRPEPGKSRQ